VVDGRVVGPMQLGRLSRRHVDLLLFLHGRTPISCPDPSSRIRIREGAHFQLESGSER
jgi:hypothetical protein